MSQNNEYDAITGMYSKWNLPESTIAELDTWALWQPTKEELGLYVYKVHKFVGNADTGVLVNCYERHLLYRGNLYHIVWQNDSAEYFFTPRGKRDERFVVSIRAKGDTKVALVQRRWN